LSRVNKLEESIKKKQFRSTFTERRAGKKKTCQTKTNAKQTPGRGNKINKSNRVWGLLSTPQKEPNKKRAKIIDTKKSRNAEGEIGDYINRGVELGAQFEKVTHHHRPTKFRLA